MKHFVLFAACLAISACTLAAGFQQLSAWQPQPATLLSPQQQQQQQLQQFARPPIAADLQNQVQALGAQLAAANRQIQFYEQQLSQLGSQQQQPAQQPGVGQLQLPLNQPIPAPVQQQQQQPLDLQAQLLAQQQQQQQQQIQQQLQQQQALQLAAQQAQAQQPQQFQQPQQLGLAQQLALQQQAQAQQLLLQQQQQPASPVSTLVDDGATAQLAADPRLAGQPAQPSAAQFFQPQQQPAPMTSTAGPATTLESPAEQHQQTAQQAAQQPQLPTNHSPVHTPEKGSNQDDKFSIGLGVLSPGYTQKFGNTALDFNQDKNGFSFTLSNNGHNNQAPKPATTGATSASSN